MRALALVERYLQDRDFRSLLAQHGEHLLWQGPTNAENYPLYRANGQALLARRYAASLLWSPVPATHVVSLTCSERLCLAPRHLRASSSRPGPQPKLSGAAVAQIAIALRDRIQTAEHLAQEFGVTPQYVRFLARTY